MCLVIKFGKNETIKEFKRLKYGFQKFLKQKKKYFFSKNSKKSQNFRKKQKEGQQIQQKSKYYSKVNASRGKSQGHSYSTNHISRDFGQKKYSAGL